MDLDLELPIKFESDSFFGATKRMMTKNVKRKEEGERDANIAPDSEIAQCSVAFPLYKVRRSRFMPESGSVATIPIVCSVWAPILTPCRWRKRPSMSS